MESLEALCKQVIACERCPRLRAYCGEVARRKRAAYAGESYWGLPVPGFGDGHARLLIVGLAPAAHGANRTGRMFTGDRSGDFLYSALWRAGFANQPHSRDRSDGLALHDAYLTAAVRCAPPANLPSRQEFANCLPYLMGELRALPRLRVLLALGALAHRQLLATLRQSHRIEPGRRYAFRHGACDQLPGGQWLFASYHPSQQNTFTGRLTESMMDKLLCAIRERL